ncbi:MAG: ribonuclease HII [Rhodospirillaceae bacterium]|jgi:ribonuclease HII|nr:ribonuclease HII [Rhodospirillaceae bacterium]MBT5243930.1 ribonuclease HII [Rhodospirillaceae bacterium]MBT5562979.1 ribonuclease HII [Rhodospirillaceae bacterium]MBT6241378.1 ribonuclease HII [Rhodospirillaceae bacterium]MBT7139047.1 ribonuclease HII [Rhodospirillaceae bacterium]
MPDFMFEYEAIAEGLGPVCGVDEAGRGPWAGPVVAGAAILDPATLPDSLRQGLDDSKKLKPEKRQTLFELLKVHAITGLGIASVEEIDALNILAATMLAMSRAVEALSVKPGMALIDGNRLPELPCPGEALVKGDGRSLSIAAASIVAKVSRDRIMAELAEEYPAYGWDHNAGYGTKKHQQGLADFGVTEHHRRSFAPIRKILER